jgi:hypothetical protein
VSYTVNKVQSGKNNFISRNVTIWLQYFGYCIALLKIPYFFRQTLHIFGHILITKQWIFLSHFLTNLCVLFSDICWLRLDFETFNILGPADTAEVLGGVCADTFKVTVRNMVVC